MKKNTPTPPRTHEQNSSLWYFRFAFGFSFIYWIYLLCTSQTEIKWDSLDYQNLGYMIYHQGWGEFFRTGPNREPLYPLLISISMFFADGLHIHYLKMLAVLQFALLFLTQFFTLKILQRINIKPLLTALVILYIGISPALINCALSLYSEILIIMLIPMTIFIMSHVFINLNKYSLHKIMMWGLILGIILLTLTFVKGIFEISGPLIILSSMFMLKRFYKTKNLLKRYVILIFVCLLTFYSGLSSYKFINKHTNGVYTLTNRGAWALYGYAARRVEPLTRERLLTALAYIPGEGACNMLFGNEKCYFWSIFSSDTFGMGKLQEVTNSGIQGEAIDKEMIRLSLQKVQSKPIQYLFFTGLEGFKIFFWESTKLGFVIYPPWLTAIYDQILFKNALRLVMAGFSLTGICYIIRMLWRNDRPDSKMDDGQFITLFFLLSLIVFYTAVYSLFLLGARYSVPTAPLFLCGIAYLVQRYYKA
ncbi:MAG: hypothetical protein H6754_00325 [Candidatus Omnitrophica bacterium]|nr:hypothetical protein [Candidatus Omnitrophota bacterium]